MTRQFWNRKMETITHRDLTGLQLKRLKETLGRVRNIRFYQKKFKDAGVKPECIKSLEDVTKLPFTRKQDLRDGYPFGFFAVPMRDVVRIHTTSGTTGKPTVVGYTRNDLAIWA